MEKILILGKIEGRRRRKGMTEDEIVGWYHQLDGHGFGWIPGGGDGLVAKSCLTLAILWTEEPGKL